MSDAEANYHVVKSGPYIWGGVDYVSADGKRDMYLRAQDIIANMGLIAESGTDEEILKKILNLYAHVFMCTRKREVE